MKKFYILISSLIVGLSIYANPIALPTIGISELYFDDSDNWKVELEYYAINPEGFTFDSIFFYSSIDTAKIPDYILTSETGQVVLTIDSLNSNFSINRLGDTLKIISYAYGVDLEDILIFGNVPGASINYPRPGQSISKYGNCFVKDKSPSIGEPNDTTGMCGTMTGYIYDKFSNPVSNREFGLSFWTKTNNDGSYMARELSKPTLMNNLSYKVGHSSYRQVGVEKAEYVMEPDSLIEINIYLLDTLATGLNILLSDNNPVKIYPNPVLINETINFNIDLPIISSDIWVEIIDLNGKLIRKSKINQKESTVYAPTKSGFYIVSVWLDSQMISSKKIIVND
ncbi:MAG: T9SS type A sorting domain-containing protein [Bacteroidales bacterium]|nr:T9SS type A sorting domain-containing protein [Bacteroidales bacterium]